jgi:hypothetical protein
MSAWREPISSASILTTVQNLGATWAMLRKSSPGDPKERRSAATSLVMSARAMLSPTSLGAWGSSSTRAAASKSALPCQ